ncbi:MAG: tetratricopeptide repeat protein [Gammaproteobacteria bacterium]
MARDLYYREVLFQYYQQDYFSAITHLLAAQEQGRIERGRTDTELLRVGIELSYGLHANALEIFKHNLSGTVDATARDRIWLSLAKTWMRRGYLDQAEDALGRIGGGLGKEGKAEQALLQARILMEKQHYPEAAATLSAVQVAPEWTPYLRYNQAVALQRSGQSDAGAALLDELGQMKSADQDLLALRDKANIALGFAYLSRQQAEAAKAALGRVRLDSPFSPRALLGIGWADYGLGNISQALKSWTELEARGVTDAAVHEASVMIPFAQWQLHAYREAVQKYRAVIDSYDGELARLDEMIAQTGQGTLIADLAADGGAGPDLDLDLLPERIADAQTRPYLLSLLASDRFRDAFTTYRNLRSQQQRLQSWTEDISAFADMLATRRYAYESRLPRVQARLQGLDWRALDAEVQDYVARVEGIAVSHDAMALTTAAEQRQIRQIERLETLLARQPQAHQLDAQRTRLRVLRGLLRWEIEGRYAPRLWEARKGVNALKEELGKAMAQRSLLAVAQVEAPKRFEGYDARIEDLRVRVTGLQQRITGVLLRHERYLQSLVYAELDRHKRELHTYRIEARYALARLLDEIATGAEGN